MTCYCNNIAYLCRECFPRRKIFTNYRAFDVNKIKVKYLPYSEFIQLNKPTKWKASMNVPLTPFL